MPRYKIITTATGPSTPIVLDMNAMFPVGLQLTGAGTSNVEVTLDNVFDPTVTPTWLPAPDAKLTGATGSVLSSLPTPVAAVRVNLASGGPVQLLAIQPGPKSG